MEFRMPQTKKDRNAYFKRRRDALVAEGICVDCKTAEAIGGTRCEVCRKKHCTYQKRRESIKHLGICPRCRIGQPVPDGTLCQRCLDWLHGYKVEWRKKRIAAGLCLNCDKPALEGKFHCPIHQERAEKYAHNYKKMRRQQAKEGLSELKRQASPGGLS